jgi:hypothetical protein
LGGVEVFTGELVGGSVDSSISKLWLFNYRKWMHSGVEDFMLGNKM